MQVYWTISNPYKVIVLDADGTLWQGVCGEIDPTEIRIPKPFRILQEFAVEQKKNGYLICLVSKNSESDVESVFEKNKNMHLQWDDISDHRINWEPKSSNIESLSKSLNLSLDSFIFIDDNALECADVRSRCPEVLTLRVPSNLDRMRAFIDRITWLMETGSTEEDSRRTQFYKEEKQREQSKGKYSSFRDFIERLELEIDISTVTEATVLRAAQLTVRTNQFNVQKKERNEEEIRNLIATPDSWVLIARVTDRFGDYGFTGLVIVDLCSGTMSVNTFLLSCRVLGRGIEHALISNIGRLALEENIPTVTISYIETEKNRPALDFLTTLDSVSQGGDGNVRQFIFESEYLSELIFDPEMLNEEQAQIPDNSSVTKLCQIPNKEEVDSLSDSVSSVVEMDSAENYSLTEYFVDLLSEIANIDSSKISSTESYSSQGIGSFKVIEFASRLESIFGPLSPAILHKFHYLTLSELNGQFCDTYPDQVRLILDGNKIQECFESVSSPIQPLQGAITRTPSLQDSTRPLSIAQELMWITLNLEKVDLNYNVPLQITIRDSIDVADLKWSFEQLIRRHDLLRCNFVADEGKINCEVKADINFQFHSVDFSAMAPDERLEKLDAIINVESTKKFDLSNAGLIRAQIIKIRNGRYLLLVTLHHLICDGWSIRILLNDLGAFYQSRTLGFDHLIPKPLAGNYHEYVTWERQQLDNGGFDAQLAFWSDALRDAPMSLKLPTDYPISFKSSSQSDFCSFDFSASESDDLRLMSRECKSSLYCTLFSIFYVLLSKFSGQVDIVVGSPVHNRNNSALREVLGYFANILPHRLIVDESQSFRSLVAYVSRNCETVMGNGEIPFSKIVELLKIGKLENQVPIVQTLFVFQNIRIDGAQIFNTSFSLLDIQATESQFDLVLEIDDTDSQLKGRFQYNSQLFDSQTIERLKDYFLILIEGVSNDPDAPLSQYNINHRAERDFIEQSSASQSLAEDSRCLHELFEEQVEMDSESIALLFEDQQLSYRSLNERSNQVAHYLVSQGIGPDKLVGLYVQRSLDLVVGVLGILKSGGGYVPLDPSYPQGRIEYQLQNSGVDILLSQSGLEEQLLPFAKHVIWLDTDSDNKGNSAILSSQPQTNIKKEDIGLEPENLAYVIYTSGSTGNPKGVLVEHRNVTRLFHTTQLAFDFTSDDVWTLFHSFAFDFSVWELWGALIYGGRLIVVPGWVSRSPEDFYELLFKEKVTVLNQTPTAFNQLIEVDGRKREKLSLRQVIFGGEALDLQKLRPWLHNHSDEEVSLVNMYGITETTVHVTYRRLYAADIEGQSGSVIGRQLGDLELYLLDGNMSLVALGVPGEIYVGGSGVARGYLNQDELTRERFIASPFGERGRLYRTGDIARRLSDGSLEYLGRIDDQVKVRGFRIELGEIESVLLQHAEVQDVVVLMREDEADDKRLVAYVVLYGELEGLSAEGMSGELREYLQDRLPDYMLPSACVILEKLPLTPNGKIDRDGLPLPDESSYARVEFVAARTATEKVLVEVWSSTLDSERISIKDHFFAIGGDSIRLISLMSEAKKRELKFSIKDILGHPTIAGLGELIDRGEAKELIEEEIAPFAMLSEEESALLLAKFNTASLNNV